VHDITLQRFCCVSTYKGCSYSYPTY